MPAAAPPASDRKPPAPAAPAPAPPAPKPVQAAGATEGQQRFDRMAVRAKLSVSEPGDAVEREADAVAAQVMRAPAAPAGQTPQAAPSPAPRPPETAPVRRQAEAGAPTGEAPTVASDVIAGLGPGEALGAEARAFFEQRLGTDLGHVLVHTDERAAEAAHHLQARAFTFGHHIAFARGEYVPGSEAGRRLLAHELAHVLQNDGGMQILRKPAASAKGKGPITLPQLTLPSLKYSAGKDNKHRKDAYDQALAAHVERPAGYRRADVDSKQRTYWTQQTPAAKLRAALDTKVKGLDPDTLYVATPSQVRLGAGSAKVIVGKPNELVQELRQPFWDAKGVADEHRFEIDHIVELQLGGASYDRADNLELLERKANGASGNAIDQSLDRAFESYAKSKDADALPKADRNKQALGSNYRVRYAAFVGKGPPAQGKRWTKDEVLAGEPALALNIYDPTHLTGPAKGVLKPWPKGVDAKTYTGSDNLLVLYPSRRGGAPKRVPLKKGQPADAGGVLKGWLPGIETKGLKLTLDDSGHAEIGQVSGRLVHKELKKSAKTEVEVPIKRRPGLHNAGVLDTESLKELLSKQLLEGGVQKLSPVVVDEVDVVPGIGLYVAGRVKPTLEPLKKAELDFQIRGTELVVFKSFSAGELALGGPIRVDDSTLSVALGTQSGLSVAGALNFSIEKLGQGTIEGKANREAFELAGSFDFDKRLFDEATVQVGYVSDKGFWGAGRIAVTTPGKIKGLKSAALKVGFKDASFSASGDVEPDVPGLKAASLSVSYDKRLVVEGQLGLDDKVPGVEAAQITVRVSEGEQGWKVAASGDVTPKLPGLKGANLKFSYDDGAVLLQGTFQIQNRVLDGTVTAGVTNAPVDEQGKPVGHGEGANFTPFGSADIGAKLGPLKGRVRVLVKPDGRVFVGGKLVLPEQELFGQHPEGEAAKRNLASIESPAIPLLGISVLGVSVGVMMYVGGSVDAEAAIGPGKLTDIALEIEPLDLADLDPAKLSVEGGARLLVYAKAALSVSAYIKAELDALVARVGGQLSVTGSVGLPPDLPVIDAATRFKWSEATGFDVAGQLSLNARPSLQFSIDGRLYAKIGRWRLTKTVWSRDYNLGKVAYKLPVGIQSTASFGWNSSTGFRFDSEAALTPKKPDLSSQTMKDAANSGSADQVESQLDEEDRPEGEPPAPVAISRLAADDQAPVQGISAQDIAALGEGMPLPLETRGFFEQRLGADLMAVRVHNGPAAAALAARVHARAFTVGRDIVFAEGLYQPGTEPGRELLAHELAHVLQQRAGAAGGVMRSTVDPPVREPEAELFTASLPGGGPGAASEVRLGLGNRAMSLPSVRLPALKQRNSAIIPTPLAVRQGRRPRTQQRAAWRADVESAARVQLTQLTAEAQAQQATVEQAGTRYYLFTLEPTPGFALVGTTDEDDTPASPGLLKHLKIPFWSPQGRPTSFQVDHVHEMQLSGVDEPANYELLASEANMGAGSAIARQVESTVSAALRALHAAHPALASQGVPQAGAWQAFKDTYQVSYRSIQWNLPHDGSNLGDRYWSRQSIQAGDHARQLQPMSAEQREAIGSAAQPAIYASRGGGIPLRALPATTPGPWLHRIDVKSWTPNTTPGAPTLGTLVVDVFKAASLREGAIAADYQDQAWRVQRMPGLNAGYIEPDDVRRVRNSLRLPGMSPIELDEIGLTDDGLRGEGRVMSTVPLIGDADIRVRIEGEEIQIFKTLAVDELHLPPPFRIDSCDLGIFYGTTSLLGVEGRLGFSIDRLGSGNLRAAASMGNGFALEGSFDFDRTLFDADASINLAYRRGGDAPDGKLSGSGRVTIGAGKVRGIRSATVEASFDGDARSLRGTAELEIPGVESATLGVDFTPEGGTTIAGSARFRDRPGIRNGQINATLAQGEGGWRLSAAGSAEASFAGVTATLAASYDDGLFMFAGNAPFAVGTRVSGNVHLGVTNGQVDDQGQLVPGSGPAAGTLGELRPFGNGNVDVRITDWLQGGVGLRVRPSGDILVSGRIGIPAPVTVFEQYPPPDRATRTLFRMPTVSVPLVGLSVGSTVVGLALTINGRVTGHAHVGPGRLTQAELLVEDFNPAQPDTLHVTGGATFDLPARAGVGASLDAGVSLGAAIVRATAGLNLSAEAGVQAHVSPHTEIDWRAATGLHLHAQLDASLAPRLAFSVNGYAEVVANALVTEFSLWRKDWNLAQREIGSSLALRLSVPVDWYSDGRGVVFDPDAVSFEVPTLNADTLAQLFNEEGGTEHATPAAGAA